MNVSVVAWWGIPYDCGDTYQTSTKEHNRNGNVLQILSSPLFSPSAQVLKEDIRSAVGEDGGGLEKLTRWSA